MTPPDAALPLQGLLVADFTRVLAGPLCTQMLADAGARVIKIEEPGRGDETRRWGPPFIDGVSPYFLSINRNKESVTLNLKSPEGAAIAAQLIDRAAVVVENFLPQQRQSLAIDRGRNPSAVWCSISGFDPDTVEARTPGYDLLAQAGSGLMSITGEPGGEAMKVGVALADVLTAHHAFGAIMVALLRRERTGAGGLVEVSLFSSALASLVNVAQSALITGREARRFGNEHSAIVPYQLFHGSNRSFAIGVGTDRHFVALCDVIGEPELAQDSKFATNAGRVENREPLIAHLDERFRRQPAERWVERCRAAAIPVSLVQGVLEALRSPAGAQLVVTMDHPHIGSYEAVGSPILLDGQRLPVRSAPPELGASTAAVLRELGHDEKAIARMHDRGVI